MINEYLTAMKGMRENTYKGAKHRLSLFSHFVKDTYQMTEDQLLRKVKTGKIDRYKMLHAYAVYAKTKGKSASGSGQGNTSAL